ncbi:MAG: hypothetical protein ACR2I2_15195 [Bryobacteraceae bacterium]
MAIFHIHVDAITLTEAFEKHLGELSFKRSDFAGHPEGQRGFEAPHHLTLKLHDSDKFRRTFDDLAATASASSGLNGYLEGEFIPLDKEILDRPYVAGVPLPFRVSNGPLRKGDFRETEIHITLDRDRSDPRLIESLTEMGFFAAYMRKPFGIAQIFTVQGSRKQVDEILPQLLNYLEACGGSANCSVKEERIAKWWLSDPSVALPPVIQAINRHEA